MGLGFGMGFAVYQGLFFLIFFIVLVIFAVTAIRGLLEWNKNNHSPRITVSATIVSKRMRVSRHHRAGHSNHMHHYSSTYYYATFQVESGDRMELSLSGSEYGLLAEGDKGTLSFQGTRYLGFERTYPE